MPKDINYDELDQAVSESIGSTTEHKHPKDPKAASATHSTTRQSRPRPRGRYLDMKSPKSDMRPRPPQRPRSTIIHQTTEFGEITISNQKSQPSVAERVISATNFISEPTPLEPRVVHKSTPPAPSSHQAPAPNPENFSLGGQSPFLENTIVEKRPLGAHLPSSNSRVVESTKNVYSGRSVTARPRVEELLTHEVVPPKGHRSGIARFFLVLLIIAIGALVGALVWFLISSGAELNIVQL